MKRILLKPVVVAATLFGAALLSYAGWCVTCYAQPACFSWYGLLESNFCGSYDVTTGCWDYTKEKWLCDNPPEDPAEYGYKIFTTWYAGFACTTGPCF